MCFRINPRIRTMALLRRMQGGNLAPKPKSVPCLNVPPSYAVRGTYKYCSSSPINSPISSSSNISSPTHSLSKWPPSRKTIPLSSRPPATTAKRIIASPSTGLKVGQVAVAITTLSSPRTEPKVTLTVVYLLVINKLFV